MWPRILEDSCFEVVQSGTASSLGMFDRLGNVCQKRLLPVFELDGVGYHPCRVRSPGWWRNMYLLKYWRTRCTKADVETKLWVESIGQKVRGIQRHHQSREVDVVKWVKKTKIG